MTRLTLRDVPRYADRWGWRDALGAWWFETPWRVPRNWRTLFLEPGRGWLRFGFDTYTVREIIEPEIGGPLYEYDCAPPLRRAWIWVWSRLAWFYRLGGWHRMPLDGDTWWQSWERLTWVEHVCTRGDFEWLRDPEWPDSYLLAPR